MGGLITPPPPPDEGKNIPPAVDSPPDNDFDILNIANAIHKAGKESKSPMWDTITWMTGLAKADINVLTFLAQSVVSFLQLVLQAEADVLDPFLKTVLKFILIILEPVKKLAGGVAGEYVKFFAGEQAGVSIGSGEAPRPHLTGTAADAFDSILAPIGIRMGGANPAEPGAGHAAAQYVLGSLVNLHLATWVVNIISNMTGLGFLHYINSFDEVILAALNTRAFGRMAFKPYINTYISEPTARDLHLQFPLKDPGPGSLVKTYIRQGLSSDQMRKKLREKGFDDEVAAQLVLDTLKELTPTDVAYLVKHGHMTQAQGVQALEQLGWVNADAEAVLQMEIHKHAEALQQAIANELVTLIGDRRVDSEYARRLLRFYQFTDEEINLYIARGTIRQEASRLLTEAQVRSLFQQNLVDLDYVQRFLIARGYSSRDADLLVLLEFTEAGDIKVRKDELAAAKRVQSFTVQEEADKSAKKGQADLAAAQRKLAAKKAARASRFGG